MVRDTSPNKEGNIRTYWRRRCHPFPFLASQSRFPIDSHVVPRHSRSSFAAASVSSSSYSEINDSRHPRRYLSHCLALGMAKRKSTIPRPPSMHLPRSLSTIPRTPTPSSALLAILASLVGSVNPFPVACHEPDVSPPSFLCPSLLPRAEVQDFTFPPQTPPPSAPIPGPSRVVRQDCPTPPPDRHARRELAPGYTQGSDGRWRKLSTWSLYGSTVCVVRSIARFSLRFHTLNLSLLVSVTTLPVPLEPSPRTTLRQPPLRHYPAKQTYFLPAGQGWLKKTPLERFSYCHYLSCSPRS